MSFRLIVLDNDLLIKKSLNILIQNGNYDPQPRPRWHPVYALLWF